MIDDMLDLIVALIVVATVLPSLIWGTNSMLKSDLGGFGTFEDKSIESSKYMDVSQTNPSNAPHTIQLDDILIMMGIVDDTMPEPSKFRFINGKDTIEMSVRLDIVPAREIAIERISTFYGVDATRVFSVTLNSADNIWEVRPL